MAVQEAGIGSATPGEGRLHGSLTFIGTATTVLRFGDFTILTDPNFLHRGQRAYLGHGMWSRRLTEPASQPKDLPDLDAVVLSHLHGDHFDRIARAELSSQLPVITTGHAAARLRRKGFERAVPLRPWASTRLSRGDQSLELTSVPGVHGPGPVGRWLMPPVMGTVLSLTHGGAAPLTVYITGDVLPGPEMSDVVRRFPDLDAIVIHLGGTRILGITLTMNGRQGADLIAAMNPPLTVPVHYDDYRVFRSPLNDFLSEAKSRGVTGQIMVVERGDTVPLAPPA